MSARAFDTIAVVAATWAVSKRDAFVALPGLADKMADMKLKGPAGDALSALSEACGPQFVCTQLHKKAAAHKNPKVGKLAFGCTSLKAQLLSTYRVLSCAISTKQVKCSGACRAARHE